MHPSLLGRASIGLNALAEMTPVTNVEPVAKKTYLRLNQTRGYAASVDQLAAGLALGAGRQGHSTGSGLPTFQQRRHPALALSALVPRTHFMASPSATEALLVGM